MIECARVKDGALSSLRVTYMTLEQNAINTIFARFAEHNPQPKIELNYKNHYTLLLAIVLSAQATDKGVNKATDRLFKVVDNPRDVIELGIYGLRNYIRSIGLYNMKAKHIVALSQMLVDEFSGQVPTTFEQLVRLPGVGRKSANVFLNTALGKECIAVDRHVFRVSSRLGLSDSKAMLGVERDLERLVPRQYLRNSHHWLVLHGRYICLATRPRCTECFLSDICICEFYQCQSQGTRKEQP